MDEKTIKVLLIEDNPGDARLVEEALMETGNRSLYLLEREHDLADGLARLEKERFDVVLLDLGLPDSYGIETFLAVARLRQDTPVIVATGLDDEELASQALAAGAQDYIVKGDFKGAILARAIRYSIERKRSEVQLRQVNAELEGYARTVSHDLRSPLSAIAIACELLSDARELSCEELRTEVDEAVESIRRNLIKSSNLIEDLLTLARAGQKPVDATEVQVSQIVKLILQERAAEIEDRGIDVTVDEDMGAIFASRTHIYQLFNNLISNAIFHNESPEPALEVRRLESRAGGHRYLVKDNGITVESGVWNNYLLPFVKGRAGSVGIGLSIITRIVELYGGKLQIYDDSGTCFEFEIFDFVPEEAGAPAPRRD